MIEVVHINRNFHVVRQRAEKFVSANKRRHEKMRSFRFKILEI